MASTNISLRNICNLINEGTGDNESLGGTHPDSTDCKMGHYKIDAIANNSMYYARTHCTNSPTDVDASGYGHASDMSWTNQHNATIEDDCPTHGLAGSHNYWYFCTIDPALTWHDRKDSVAQQMLGKAGFYSANSAGGYDGGATDARYLVKNANGVSYGTLRYFGGETPPWYSDSDSYSFYYGFADGINMNATNYSAFYYINANTT